MFRTAKPSASADSSSNSFQASPQSVTLSTVVLFASRKGSVYRRAHVSTAQTPFTIPETMNTTSESLLLRLQHYADVNSSDSSATGSSATGSATSDPMAKNQPKKNMRKKHSLASTPRLSSTVREKSGSNRPILLTSSKTCFQSSSVNYRTSRTTGKAAFGVG